MNDQVEFTNGIVTIQYKDLLDGKDLTSSISSAFGFQGLGILIVKGIPNIMKLRKELLPLGQKFANLPEEIKNKTVHKESFYSFGWSHGKEMMAEGKPDLSKGSYYNNPQYDVPFDSPELIKKYPAFCNPNIWPREDLPELEPAFKNMGALVVEVGLLVAKQCDSFTHSLNSQYPDGKLFTIIKNCRTAKARLLHYFPLEVQSSPQSSSSTSKTKEVDFASWCGWHNDHGSLTGLVPAMYHNPNGEEVPSPDPSAGLYIRSRDGNVVKATVPPDSLAFQIGETSQIHSGGLLQATPHCVKGAEGPNSRGISRQTFAVFMEPMWDEKMNLPSGAESSEVLRGSSTKHLPSGVPLLESRWDPVKQMDFGQFTEITLKSYY